MTQEREISRKGAVLVGVIVAAAGIAVVLVAFLAGPERFGAPRWVVGACGGAFLFFGGYTAAIYASGYDPKRPDASLPSPALQLAVFLPGLLLFATPFHWIAFWPGPRTFESSVSLPFLSGGGVSHGWMGRAVFGAGAIVIDLLIVAMVVSLVRKILHGEGRQQEARRP